MLEKLQINKKRVSIIPNDASTLVKKGSNVIVASNAGSLNSYSDKDYKDADVSIVESNDAVMSSADVLVSVRTPSSD